MLSGRGNCLDRMTLWVILLWLAIQMGDCADEASTTPRMIGPVVTQSGG